MITEGFEPSPFRTAALMQRLRPLGHIIVVAVLAFLKLESLDFLLTVNLSWRRKTLNPSGFIFVVKNHQKMFYLEWWSMVSGISNKVKKSLIESFFKV